MSRKNMSDIIEAYLKAIIEENSEGSIEIQRSEIAERFDCVPSQINYVINTRFTTQHGYRVESKRGGGGYIRIHEVQMHDQADLLQKLIQMIGTSISEKDAEVMIQTLYQREAITEKEGKLMLAAIQADHYLPNHSLANRMRASIFTAMLKQLMIIV